MPPACSVTAVGSSCRPRPARCCRSRESASCACWSTPDSSAAAGQVAASAHRLPAPDTRQRTGRGAYAQAQDSRAAATVTDPVLECGAARPAGVGVAAGCGPPAGAGAAGSPDRPRGHRRRRRQGADQVSQLPKITPVHLGRDAYVYVRQSTITQVREHTESLQRQYELVERATQLGWLAHQVVVIDEDLGRSGADASAREGFKGLVADVGLGKVGLILGIEVSRLARNNADWYQLLDLCALTDTLIADGDGVYHPGLFNDRLVLGLKGTMSEAELHLLRSRLTEGLRAKAARGELRLVLPAGLDYDDDDHVIITPDEAAREAITCVFRRFGQLGSARQVVVSLRGDGLRLPRRDIRTGKIAWAQAGYPAVHDILIHPGYAGVFAYGRSKTEKHLDASGNVTTRQRRLPRDQWAVMIPGHHPGYICLET